MSLIDLISQSRAKLQKSTGNRAEKLSSEKNLVRILVNPNAKGSDVLYQDWGQHYIKDQHGQLKAVYVCTQTTFEEPCAVCEAIAAAAAQTYDEDVLKALKDSRSSRRILVNALYLKGGKHDNPDTNPVVLDIPPSVWDSILATAEAFDAEGINVFDLNEGHNFIIEKTGTGMNTEYKVTPSPKPSKIDAEVAKKVRNLSDWARQESEAEKAKAVTSVRAIAGVSGGVSTPRLEAPKTSRTTSLADADVIDASFVEVDAGADDDLDEFLKNLG